MKNKYGGDEKQRIHLVMADDVASFTCVKDATSSSLQHWLIDSCWLPASNITNIEIHYSWDLGMMFMGSGTQPFSPARLASNATTATNQTQDFPLKFEVRNLSNNCRFWPRPHLSAIVTPHQICALTPLKINMEHNHGSLVQIIFLSKCVMFRFHVNLRNCNCELTKVSRNTKKKNAS